jgi:DUF971 family protein
MTERPIRHRATDIQVHAGSRMRSISFDDGHDTAIYSWDSLYALGAEQEKNRASYLRALSPPGALLEIGRSQ